MPTFVALAAISGAVAGSVAAGALAFSWSAFATSLVLGGLSRALQKSPEQPAGSAVSSSGRLITVRQPVAPWQIVVGQARVGGVPTFINVNSGAGGDSNRLDMIITLAGHVCQEIGDIYFDDEIVPLDGTYPNGGGAATGKYAGYVFVHKSLGNEAGQPFAAVDSSGSGLVAESDGKWTDAHRQTGRAKIWVRLLANPDLFPNGVPNITAVVKGEKVYDPRTATTVYSNNVALWVSHYLTSATYGLGAVYADEIDAADLIAAANVCDEAVNLTAGGTETRYIVNGAFLVSDTPKNIIEQLLNGMAGTAVAAGSKWHIHAGAYEAPTLTFDENDLAGSISVQSLVSRRENCNGVKGTFTDPASSWQPTDFPPVASGTYLAEDGGERVWRDIDLTSFVTRGTQAQRLAKIELLRTRQGLTCAARFKLSAWRAMTGRTIALNNIKFGWSAKPFDVQSSRFVVGDDGTLNVELALRETAAAVYNWATSEEQTVDIAPNTNLPDPFAVTPPTSLVLNDAPLVLKDGTVVPRILVTWTPSGYAFTTGWEVRYRITGATDWQTQIVTNPAIIIQPVSVGDAYDIQVFTLTPLGRSQTALVTTGHVATGQITAPPAPTALTATGGLFRVALAWTLDIGTRRDIRHTEIWASTTNNRAAAARITCEPWPMLAYNHIGLSPGQSWYYWARLEDTSGNHSAYYPSSATGGVAASPSTDPSALLTQLQDAVGLAQLAQELAQPISVDFPNTVLDVQKVSETALRLLLKADETKQRTITEKWISDATVVVDKATGTVTLLATAEVSTDIEAHLNQVDLTLGAQDGSIIAHTASLANHAGRITVAETDITSLEGSVSIKASTSYVDSTVATALGALDPAAQEVFTATNAIGLLHALLDADAGRIVAQSSIARLAVAERTLDTNADAISAEAAERVILAAKVDNNVAALVAESSARASGDSANASSISTLSAQVNHATTGLPAAHAAVSAESSARASGDSANASSISTLSAQVNHATTGLPAAHAAVSAESSARASGDSANASSISTVQARLDTGDYAAVKTESSANASAINGIKAKYAVKVDANGHVIGFELINNGTVGSFVILADKLLIAKPDGSGIPKQVMVLGTVNGVSALGFDGNIIVDGSVLARHLAVTSLDAITATIGLLRTATIGARLEIASNVIRVYDASNVLRVKMGDLA